MIDWTKTWGQCITKHRIGHYETPTPVAKHYIDLHSNAIGSLVLYTSSRVLIPEEMKKQMGGEAMSLTFC